MAPKKVSKRHSTEVKPGDVFSLSHHHLDSEILESLEKLRRGTDIGDGGSTWYAICSLRRTCLLLNKNGQG